MGKVRKVVLSAVAVIAVATAGVCLTTDVMDNVRGALFEKVKFEDDSNYTSVPPKESVDCEYYESNGEISFGYDSLYTESQKACYKSIGEAVYKISEDINEFNMYPVGKVNIDDKNFTEKDIDICVKAYTMDHPDVFWLANRYSYGSAGNQSIVQLYSYVGGVECRQKMNELNQAIEDLVTKIPGKLNQYHLEKYIHNTLLDRCSYANGVKTAEDGWEEFTTYGALVNGSAVCEGYAHTMCLLLNKVGIDAYYANGYGESDAHMWNTVNIDGNWYHLDATWDDNENAFFNYFNLNDAQIVTDHVIASSLEDIKQSEQAEDVYNIFLPECNSDSANYFVVESTYIVDFDESREIMVNDLIAAAEEKDDMFTVRIDSGLDFDEAMKVMFDEEPYYMFDYIREANESLDEDHQISDSNVSIIILDTFNAVVVKLDYE